MCEWRPRLKTDEEIIAAFKEEMAEDLATIQGTDEQQAMMDAIDAAETGICPYCGRAFNAKWVDGKCPVCGKYIGTDNIFKKEDFEKYRAENERKNDEVIKTKFPNEIFLDANNFEFKKGDRIYDVPTDLTGIKISQSRYYEAIKDDDKMEILAKEIRQANILTEKGDVIYLTPENNKNENKQKEATPDAIRNGSIFEFKTVTVDGNRNRVGKNFRDSRSVRHFQSENVFISILNPDIKMADALASIHGVLSDSNYTGGTEGTLILHVVSENETKYFKIKDLK